MYEKTTWIGANLNAHFASMLDRYSASGDIAGLVDKSILDDDGVDLLLEFSRYLARKRGERAAIDFCETLHHHLLDFSLGVHVGRVLLVQAELFNQIGKGMSRDLYAMEAAEAFLLFDLMPAAEKALAMVRA